MLVLVKASRIDGYFKGHLGSTGPRQVVAIGGSFGTRASTVEYEFMIADVPICPVVVAHQLVCSFATVVIGYRVVVKICLVKHLSEGDINRVHIRVEVVWVELKLGAPDSPDQELRAKHREIIYARA